MFQTKILEKTKTHFMFKNIFQIKVESETNKMQPIRSLLSDVYLTSD